MSDHSASNIIEQNRKPGGILRYIPYFLLVFVVYLVAALGSHSHGTDPAIVGVALHDPWLGIAAYKASWVDILLILSALLTLAEQMKVSHPGIDNTLEALTMIGMGVVQLMLFVLGVAHVGVFVIFSNLVFLELTFVSLAASIVAVLINARTLRRSIGLGDN